MSEETQPVPQTRELVVIQSKVRDIIKAKDATARVSEEFIVALSDEVYHLIDRALVRCNENKRKTLGKADV